MKKLGWKWTLFTVMLTSVLLLVFSPLPLSLIGIIPTLNFQTVAVELENGEVFETTLLLGGIGAVTRNGEYLIEYNTSTVEHLAKFAALYTKPYYDTRAGLYDFPGDGWKVTNSKNAWFDGVLSYNSLKDSYTSERVYHSPTSYHYESTLYDRNGTVIWSHDDREKLSSSYTQRATIGFSRRGGGGNFIDFIFPECINIHQFMAKVYGIDVEMVYNKKDRLVIFKIPKSP